MIQEAIKCNKYWNMLAILEGFGTALIHIVIKVALAWYGDN